MAGGFKAWEKQFTSQVINVEKVNKRVLGESVDVLTDLIKSNTPEGKPELWKYPYVPKNYVPGTLRAAWENGQTSPMNYQIYNNEPYGPRVEYFGWSTQAPEGMMRKSNLSWSKIVDQVSRRFKI